jgi:uncharacterized protein YlzI (FlbEa/FlbD family)
MIILHRLGHTDEPFQLNPDLIVTVESTPDTVVTLATTAKVVVAETPREVADAVRAWRVEVLSEAMRGRRPEHEPAPVRDLMPRRPEHEPAPARAAPVQAAPVQAPPVQAAPVQAPPAQAAPMQAAPVQGLPSGEPRD